MGRCLLFLASADVFLSVGRDDRDRGGVNDVAMSLADMDRLMCAIYAQR